MENFRETGDGYIIGYARVKGNKVSLGKLADGGERVLVSIDLCSQKVIIDFLDENQAKMDSGLEHKERNAPKVDEKKTSSFTCLGKRISRHQ